MRQQIERLLDQVIRPLVEADGGHIELAAVDEDEVVVSLQAACAGCPGAHYTRKHVIEPAVHKAVGTHVRVRVETSAATTGAAVSPDLDSSR